MSHSKAVGHIGWLDLTVDDASGLKDFYESVLGWKTQPLSLGEYDDYVMLAGEEAVGGICHARGANAELPPQWLVYVNVADLDASIEQCLSHGGQVVSGPREADGTRFCVIRDPTGAVMAIASAAS